MLDSNERNDFVQRLKQLTLEDLRIDLEVLQLIEQIVLVDKKVNNTSEIRDGLIESLKHFSIIELKTILQNAKQDLQQLEMEKSTPKTDSDSLIEQLMALIEERQDEPFTKQEREQLESDFQQKSIQHLTKDIKREKKQLKEYLVKKVFETSSDDKKRDDTYYDDLEKMNIEKLELQFKINLINRIKHIQDVNGVRTYEVPELLSKVNSFSVKEVKRMEKHIQKRAEPKPFYSEKDLKEEVKKEAEKKRKSTPTLTEYPIK